MRYSYPPYINFSRGKRLIFIVTKGRVTSREREILKLIAEGYYDKEIAEFLHISVKTVEKHRANIMKKLDIHNVVSLTAYANERGLTN